MDVKFSIIIPHKNSVHLLMKLLATIPDREDIEVIIIDDNSVLKQKEKLTKSTFNSNVQILYNNFSEGAGKARNIGIRNATGEWILFADADDYFSNHFESILDKYYSSTADIIYFQMTSVYINTCQKAERHKRYEKLVSEYLENYDTESEDALRYLFTPPVGKMIKHNLIKTNKIHFEEIVASNDILFSLKSAFYANQITASNDLFYIITMSSGSLTNTLSKKHFDSRFKAALRANAFLRSINKKKFQHSVLYFLGTSFRFGIRYFIIVIAAIIKNRSNLLIGLSKIFNYKEVLNKRENKKYLIKDGLD